ncbi:MAG: hypothetical protein P8Y71_17855 [Pseudolabrys sp.]|jgi:phage terminase small subunit
MQRGRKSALKSAAFDVDVRQRRLQPPSHLNDVERELFQRIVGSVSKQHFAQSDVPLIESFVRATLLSRESAPKDATDAEALANWEKATRLQAMLATRLRLTPQARTDPKTLARQQPPLLDPPWER